MRSRDKRKDKRGRPEGPSYGILDRAMLASAVTGAYRPGRGMRARAAMLVGLSDDTLAKIEARKQGALSPSTLAALYKLVPPQDHPLIESAILPAKARGRLALAAQFTTKWRARLERADVTPRLSITKNGAGEAELVVDPAGPFHRPREFNYLIARAKALPLGEEFTKDCEKRGHRPERVALAWARIVAPLLDYHSTDWVERAWMELSSKELNDFLTAGIKRERILLARPNDGRRVQQVVKQKKLDKAASLIAGDGDSVDPLHALFEQLENAPPGGLPIPLENFSSGRWPLDQGIE